MEDRRSKNDIETVIRGPVRAVCARGIVRLCRLPYPDHPNGCPNFGVRADCPPFVPYFLDTYKDEVFIVAVIFDFESYLKQRQKLYPHLKDRALRNLLYWQGHVKSELRKFISETDTSFLGDTVIYTPEAMGVNVFETCKKVGLFLERKPAINVHKIALVARRLK